MNNNIWVSYWYLFSDAIFPVYQITFNNVLWKFLDVVNFRSSLDPLDLDIFMTSKELIQVIQTDVVWTKGKFPLHSGGNYFKIHHED